MCCVSVSFILSLAKLSFPLFAPTFLLAFFFCRQSKQVQETIGRRRNGEPKYKKITRLLALARQSTAEVFPDGQSKTVNLLLNGLQKEIFFKMSTHHAMKRSIWTFAQSVNIHLEELQYLS